MASESRDCTRINSDVIGMHRFIYIGYTKIFLPTVIRAFFFAEGGVRGQEYMYIIIYY